MRVPSGVVVHIVSKPTAPEPINRKLRTKLPQLEMYCDYDFDVQKCRDNDAEMKEKRKMYADVKRNAVNNDLKVGDKVLLKQNESNKMSTVYRKDPFIITERKGNCVTVQNDDVCLKRNITHVKRFNPCTNVCDYSRNDGGETHDSDSTLDHVNCDCENNLENDVTAKCLRPREILKQPKCFDD